MELVGDAKAEMKVVWHKGKTVNRNRIVGGEFVDVFIDAMANRGPVHTTSWANL